MSVLRDTGYIPGAQSRDDPRGDLLLGVRYGRVVLSGLRSRGWAPVLDLGEEVVKELRRFVVKRRVGGEGGGSTGGETDGE